MLVGGAQHDHLGVLTPGQLADEDGRDQEGDDRHDVARAADAERQPRLGEEEVVGERRSDRGVERDRDARAHRDQGHRADEEQREAGDRQDRAQRESEERGDRDGRGREREVAHPAGGRGPALERAPGAPTGARGVDDGELEPGAALEQALGDRATEGARERPLARAPDQDRRDALTRGVGEELLGDVGATQRDGLAAQPLGELEGGVERRAIGARAAGVDVGDRPGRLAPLGEAPRDAHQILGLVVAVDGDQDPPPERHAARHAARGQVLAQVGVDAIGRGLHRQLAQRRQVRGREVAIERRLRALGDVDLALAQPLDQLARRQVDEHDVGQAVEEGVGNPSRGP